MKKNILYIFLCAPFYLLAQNPNLVCNGGFNDGQSGQSPNCKGDIFPLQNSGSKFGGFRKAISCWDVCAWHNTPAQQASNPTIDITGENVSWEDASITCQQTI